MSSPSRSDLWGKFDELMEQTDKLFGKDGTKDHKPLLARLEQLDRARHVGIEEGVQAGFRIQRAFTVRLLKESAAETSDIITKEILEALAVRIEKATVGRRSK